VFTKPFTKEQLDEQRRQLVLKANGKISRALTNGVLTNVWARADVDDFLAGTGQHQPVVMVSTPSSTSAIATPSTVPTARPWTEPPSIESPRLSPPQLAGRQQLTGSSSTGLRGCFDCSPIECSSPEPKCAAALE
jgi:hypothetical protein